MKPMIKEKSDVTEEEKDVRVADLVSFLGGWCGDITSENKALYQKIIEGSEIQSFNNNDYEEFHLSIIYPFNNFIDGFIRSEISDNHDVAFLMANSEFVEHHFEEWVRRKEGAPCSADKSRTIIRSLIKFYSKGKKIAFNYEAEYTYHLPKTVFKTHDQIVEFYEGLKSLFYGKPEKYLKALMGL